MMGDAWGNWKLKVQLEVEVYLPPRPFHTFPARTVIANDDHC